MKLSPKLQANWQLVKALCFPAPWIMWVFVAGLILLLLGDVLIWRVGSILALVAGTGLTFLYLFVLAIYIPAQMIALASSKQFYWLENFRIKLAVMLMMGCFLVSVFIELFLLFSAHSPLPVTDFISIFCAISLIMSAAIFFRKYFRLGEPVVFILGILFIKNWNSVVMPNAFLGIVWLVLIWVAFLYWWLNWKPSHFQKSGFGLSQAEMLAYQNRLPVLSIDKFLKIKPKSLLGTLLLGNADGWLSQLKRAVVPIVVIAVIMSVASLFVGVNVFVAVLKNNVNLFMLFSLSGFAYAFNLSLFRNLYKIWMFYGGSRGELAAYIERAFFPSLLTNMAFIVTIYITCLLVSGISAISAEVLLFIIVSSALMAALTFYVAMIIYCKVKSNINWNMFVNGFLHVAFVFLLYANLWQLGFNSQLIVICIASLIAIIFLRLWAHSLWRYADLRRME